MAIDLCNKAGLLGAETAEEARESVDERRPRPADVLDLVYQSAISQAKPPPAIGDPAAWASDFGYALDRVSSRLDARTREQLRSYALDHPDPVMREQALFEYADRDEPDAIDLLRQACQADPDRQVRWDSLWAIEKLGGAQAVDALRAFRHDPDPEIAEWASLYLGELLTGDPVFDDRPARFTPGRTFDETIFLLIHCDLYVRLSATNRQWGKLSLAPQGLARVYGQAHACPNVATRERQLVIAKEISGLHPDGSAHLDNYLFRGFTERTRADRANFFFESQVDRPFYLSGRADDSSDGVRDARIGFMRQGCWFLDDRVALAGDKAIRYVRGRFQGWGYINLSAMVGKSLDQILLPGNAILSTLHDPVVGPLTNVFIAGTFKGKLNDWDADGAVDLNSRNVYSTTEGEVDTDMDNVPDRAGVACCNWSSPL